MNEDVKRTNRRRNWGTDEVVRRVVLRHSMAIHQLALHLYNKIGVQKLKISLSCSLPNSNDHQFSCSKLNLVSWTIIMGFVFNFNKINLTRRFLLSSFNFNIDY
jgi:hypothetical protein